MSNYSMDCFPNLRILPNRTFIDACQSAANTTFCWPPNGTRICVPSEDIPFYWPRTYYPSDARLAIEYDLSSRLLLVRNNTGNRSEDFTQYMFERKANAIPGTANEKTMKMYMRERRFGDDVTDKWNLQIHEGPTLVLVKTADFTTTRTSARATATGRTYRSGYDSDDDDKPNLSSGAIAGIVIAAVVGFIILISCCCHVCCGKKTRAPRPKINKEEQARMVAQGTELMEQRGSGRQIVVGSQVDTLAMGIGGGRPLGENGIGRAEEARAGRFDDAPPKYTP